MINFSAVQEAHNKVEIVYVGLVQSEYNLADSVTKVHTVSAKDEGHRY